MTKQLAEILYALTANPNWMAFIEYEQSRLDQIHKDMEFQDHDAVKKSQGQIAEIRNIFRLHSTVSDYLSSKSI
jgi:hypothetical protein